MPDKRTVVIPNGTDCTFGLKHCIFAVYSVRMKACNCRLYHRLLKGGGNPAKCQECLAESKQKSPEAAEV